MVEASSKKIRYIAVSLVRDAGHNYKPTRIGSLLVSIGVVRRVDNRQAVAFDGLPSEALASAPVLHARAVTRAGEDATLNRLPSIVGFRPRHLYQIPDVCYESEPHSAVYARRACERAVPAKIANHQPDSAMNNKGKQGVSIAPPIGNGVTAFGGELLL
jgi:hypothetical protein